MTLGMGSTRKVRLLQTIFLLCLICSSSISAAANRKLCGSHLSDALRLLCQGTYKSRQAREAVTRERHERDVNSAGVVAECCVKACDVPTLLSYCGSVGGSGSDSPSSFASLISSLKASVHNLSGSKSGGADKAAPASPGQAGNSGRFKELLSKMRSGGFDLSPLLDDRLEEYDQPFQQKR